MEIKLLCVCGQKFKFDVEPVNGRMPFAVNCPACGADQTAAANAMLAQSIPPPPEPASGAVPMAPPVPAGPPAYRISRPGDSASADERSVAAFPGIAPPKRRIPIPRYGAPDPESLYDGRKPRLVLGIIGIFLGAAAGSTILFLMSVAMGIKFPLLGTLTGATTGYGGYLFLRRPGEISRRPNDVTFGGIAAAVAGLSVAATCWLLFAGDLHLSTIISIFAASSIAYRIAAC